MLHYGDSRYARHGTPIGGGLAQSTFDVLLGMRGVAVRLLFLDLSNPERPVAEVPGFVDHVDTTHLALGLSASLPDLNPRTRFGVEVMMGPNILRFRAPAHEPPEKGSTRIKLDLPHQIETIQRRMFSRAAVSVSVAFSPLLEAGLPEADSGGIGQSGDLSASGMRMTTHHPLRFGQMLLVGFNTPDGAVYRGLTARVVRVQPTAHGFSVALHFKDLSRVVENQLVQTVFRLQLRGMAKQ